MTHSLFSLFPIKKINIKARSLLGLALFGLTGCAAMNMNSDHGIFDDDLMMGSSAPDRSASEKPWNTDNNSRNRDSDSDSSSYENRVQNAVSRRDIVLGMGQSEVTAAWGHPRDIEVAGSPDSGNERWIYYVGNSRTYGMSNPKIIYFEQGHVVGWESANR